MSFVRPEVRAFLHRWRDALVGEMVLLIGLYWVLVAGGLLYYLGYLLIFLGGIQTVIGVQRARFRNGSGGPGVVQVDEGKVSYYGPLTGGSVALNDLTRVSMVASGKPVHWVLDQPGQPSLYIPINAAGADALFDAFAALPGIRTERMLAQMRQASAQAVVIWEKSPQMSDFRSLH